MTIKPVPQKRNANRHTVRGMAALETSIATDGWIGAITVAADGETFDGSARVEKTAENGMLDDPIVVHSDGQRPIVVVRDDIPNATDPRAVRLGISANRIASLNLEWEPDVLQGIVDSGIDLGSLFTDLEWADVAMPALPEARAGGDEFLENAEEAPERVKVGDIWQLGPHRLICGSSADRGTVTRLTNGARPSLCFTSPPYAAQREYTIGSFDWDALMDGVFLGLYEHLAADASILVNLGLSHKDGRVVRYWDDWVARMEADCAPLYGWYVWDQGWGLPGDWAGRLAPSFEFVFHFAKRPRHTNKTEKTISEGQIRNSTFRHADGTLHAFTGNGEATGSTKVADSVVRVNRQIGAVDGGDHPAVFSVDFPAHCIPIWTKKGDVVYEPFAGSGTTLIAAHRTERIAYCVELEPRYCDVILRRWEMETKQEPIVIDRLTD